MPHPSPDKTEQSLSSSRRYQDACALESDERPCSQAKLETLEDLVR